LHQVRQLISVELPETVRNYQFRSVIVLGLLYAFDEYPNVRMKDIEKEIVKITQAINVNDYPPNTSCNIRSTRRQALRTSFVCIQETHQSSSRKRKTYLLES
jgi:small nuclear ribonucleoprotein (snRNP)-like protein